MSPVSNNIKNKIFKLKPRETSLDIIHISWKGGFVIMNRFWGAATVINVQK